ncbi:MAG: hypothetical protein HYY18_02760 [Planctomycetes bacterium]|nr:hypothetical protein [Planctomycetota bacterium]
MKRVLLACALLTAGCKGDPPENNSRPEDRFDITRPGATLLDGALFVSSMLTWPRPDKTIEAYEAKLENRGGQALALEIRTVWKDSDDKEVAAGPWAPFDLPPGAAYVAGGDAEVPSARYVKLEVRKRE